MTTIVSVRKGNQVVVAGDGQVSLGQTVMKHSARKVRRLAGGSVIAGFAGATADAFTLSERLEAKLESQMEGMHAEDHPELVGMIKTAQEGAEKAAEEAEQARNKRRRAQNFVECVTSPF